MNRTYRQPREVLCGCGRVPGSCPSSSTASRSRACAARRRCGRRSTTSRCRRTTWPSASASPAPAPSPASATRRDASPSSPAACAPRGRRSRAGSCRSQRSSGASTDNGDGSSHAEPRSRRGEALSSLRLCVGLESSAIEMLTMWTATRLGKRVHGWTKSRVPVYPVSSYVIFRAGLPISEVSEVRAWSSLPAVGDWFDQESELIATEFREQCPYTVEGVLEYPFASTHLSCGIRGYPETDLQSKKLSPSLQTQASQEHTRRSNLQKEDQSY